MKINFWLLDSQWNNGKWFPGNREKDVLITSSEMSCPPTPNTGIHFKGLLYHTAERAVMELDDSGAITEVNVAVRLPAPTE